MIKNYHYEKKKWLKNDELWNICCYFWYKIIHVPVWAFHFRDVSAIHFDPTKEDHKQFEMEPNKKKEKVVKTNKLVK